MTSAYPKILRPAILPDDQRVFWTLAALGLCLAALGWDQQNIWLMVLPLLALLLFLGGPILFHSLYHFLVRVEVYEDRLALIDNISHPFVPTKGRQCLAFADLDFVYSPLYEMEALMKLEKDEAPFFPTRIDTRKFLQLRDKPATYRNMRGMVLADRLGKQKVYFMHFHSLSAEDQKTLLETIQDRTKCQRLCSFKPESEE